MNLAELKWRTVEFCDLDVSLLYSILELRQEIFVVEQSCAYRDMDRLDQVSTHIICSRGEKTIAYARSAPPDKDSITSSLSRIVVSRNLRNLGIGKELIKRAIKKNFEKWPLCHVKISAQTYLINFYITLGFKICGSEYLEDGIPHIEMVMDKNPE